ncbi:MAG: DNA polymerase/3'-5' exonuclease PolX [Sphingobacteriales bacterium]|nr:MAG: DNA polymerase/3'-5' exonuclease PolX [Sphingobacteriales bacterium]TAF78917.1 MAG: DNA polymerase/3'-5' exonuclease PolX [Sphingobacteriales bacterium]
MENKKIASHLKLLSQLMELHHENPFKIKSIANSYFKIDKLPFKLAEKTLAEIETIEGIGKSLAAKIVEILQTNKLQELDDLIAQTPLGIIEMLAIKGLGPKKIDIIWNVLGIDNIGELYYACNENRLIEAKGFGLKTQEDIKLSIEFKMASNGKFLYAKIENLNQYYVSLLGDLTNDAKVYEAGEFRRKCEIINQLVYVIATADIFLLHQLIIALPDIEILETTPQNIVFKDSNNATINILLCTPEALFTQLFIATGSPAHILKMSERLDLQKNYASENEIYTLAGMAYIEPELREGTTEIEKALQNTLPKLIVYQDLKGTLHNHSNWSDGVNSIEEMAIYCRDELKLQYLGLCDHSKSAVYAKGLSIERVLQQHQEIDSLNKKLAPFKIFKGIESDILGDGSLDYPDEILSRFDFVVASIHQNLKMDEQKATNRLIKAIENPHTTILGHPTGRLLLSRKGYDIDYKKVIDACADNNVAIEINANPLRLDLDWRWHQYALDKGVKLCINPDAHRLEGFLDMHYGIYIARKGGLNKQNCLNAFNLDEMIAYFTAKKQGIKI